MTSTQPAPTAYESSYAAHPSGQRAGMRVQSAMPAPARGTRGVVFAQLVGLAVAVAISGAILGTVVLGLLFGTMNNVG